jgi:hypothetical protein
MFKLWDLQKGKMLAEWKLPHVSGGLTKTAWLWNVGLIVRDRRRLS